MRPIEDPSRRRWVGGGLRWLAGAGLGGAAAGCAVMPPMSAAGSTEAGLALYARASRAHGIDGYTGITDINVAYEGHWHGLVQRLQPVLADAGFRRTSEERLLPVLGAVGQAHAGPMGSKHVVRRRDASGQGDDIRVWRNGVPVQDAEALRASALVADAYRLFLLGPLAYAGSDAGFDVGDPIWIGDRRCDALLVAQVPGFGQRGEDKVVMYIDQRDGLMRRVRFTLEGLQSTRGAIVEVDTDAHVDRHGVRWPTRFFERLVRPIPSLPVHRWRLTGLDVNRGYGRDALALVGSAAFGGAAAPPATPLRG
ncbi:MAG: hypothetical protein AB7P21_13775 [Lautropia sp.]